MPPADRVQRVLAIDPGQKGALAWVNLRGDLIDIEDIPLVSGDVNAKLLSNLIVGSGNLECAVVEKQQAMPPELHGRRQGNASAFKHGTGYGIIIGVLAALNIPTFFPTPGQWKKPLGLSRDKELSRQKAISRWPAQAEQFFKYKKNEGRAEAALLGIYWIQSDERRSVLASLQGEAPRPNSKRRLIRRYQETDPTTVEELEHE